MRKEQTPNYWLAVSTNSYTGNFVRELIAYAFGILDEVQMEIDYGEEYLDQFYKEENMTYEQCCNELNEYLFETYQEVDDWEQMTFYNTDWYKSTKNRDAIFIQLDKPFDGVWKERVIRRIQKFFNDNILKKTEDAIWQRDFGHDSYGNEKTILEHLELLDSNKNVLEIFK